ncbi:hypothetical protein [Sulfurimonas sp.]|uniref:hypothetical protein n=1 Tax=Sulfurimonas sp. TaxID=2022749 RepID=UPI0025F22E5F|nr:hypothetical protein [Sulfurimonas sp.]MBW6488674.1 hypothetical protein [Sulfurimonas sp.]
MLDAESLKHTVSAISSLWMLIAEEALSKISNEKGEEYTLDNHIIASSNAFVHSDLLCHIG